MAQKHERMLAWVLPLVAPVPPAQRDAAHKQMVDERFTVLMAAINTGLEGYEAIEAAMTAVALKPGETPPPLSGAHLIAEEVHRVRTTTPRTLEQDIVVYAPAGRGYASGNLATAAAAYASHVGESLCRPARHPSDYRSEEPMVGWPWGMKKWKPRSPREDLIRAGALIAMQLDLIDYLEAKERESAA